MALLELPEPVRRICFRCLGGADGHAVRRVCRQFFTTPIASGACLRVNLREPGRVAPADQDGDDVAPPWWRAATRVELFLPEAAVQAGTHAIRRLAAACPNVVVVRLDSPRQGLLAAARTAALAWPGLAELDFNFTDAAETAGQPTGVGQRLSRDVALMVGPSPQLRRLVVGSVDQAKAATICQRFTQLEDLELGARLREVRTLLRGLPELRRLRCRLEGSVNPKALAASGLLNSSAAVTLELGPSVTFQGEWWSALRVPRLRIATCLTAQQQPPPGLKLAALTQLSFTRVESPDGLEWLETPAAVQAAVAVACPGLTTAELWLTADGLRAVAAACPHLTDLELTTSARALGALTLARLRRLRCDCKLTDETAGALAACPALEDASLWVTPAAMAAVLQACPRLTALDVLLARDDRAAPGEATHVACVSSLRSLKLDHVGVDLAPVLGPIAHAFEGAVPVPGPPVRLRLWSRDRDLGPAELEALASGAFVLEELGCRPDEATLLALAEAAAAPSARVRLQTVGLRGDGVTDRAFVALCRASPSLAAVTLEDTGRLTDAALAQGLAALGPGLRSVDARFTRPHLATERCVPAIRGACPWARVQFHAAKEEHNYDLSRSLSPPLDPQPPTKRC